MRNIYTNSVNFKFSPVSSFGYTERNKYAKGVIKYDTKGNAAFNCNNYNYCNYRELLEFLEGKFETNYSYRNVQVEFYGKHTRSVRVGRTSIEVTAEDKISLGEVFLPDLILGLSIIKLYDSIKPYGFNRKFVFTNKTSEEILDFFEVKFVCYELNKESYLESKKIPTSATCWKQYVAETRKTYSQWEWEHSHCENVDDDESTFENVDYTLPTAFKVVGKVGTLITSKYHREYDIVEVKAFDPSNRVKCHVPNFVVYVPKDRDKYKKVYTFPEFEKYIRKECTFNSVLEAACSLIDRLSN